MALDPPGGASVSLLGTKGAAMHYLAIGRYNAQGAAGVLKDGLTSRKEVLREFAEREGNKLLGVWGVQESDLDFVILMEGEMGPEMSAATSLGQRSMGHVEVLNMYTLVETEDVDATLKASDTVTRAPGEA